MTSPQQTDASTQPVQSELGVLAEPPRRRSRLVRPIAVLVVAVLIAGGVVAAVRGSSSGVTGSPLAVTDAYYGDLAAHQAPKAFDLLCMNQRQLMGLAGYVHLYTDDVATGTGIHSFTFTADQVNVDGNEAEVPGQLVLDDMETVPIAVIAVKESGAWRVCTSDLGGVLPNPGTSGGNNTGGITT